MRYMLILALIFIAASAAPTFAQTVYSCDFEPAEQSDAFTTGLLTGQGTPPWVDKYVDAGDDGGQVVNTQALTGSQSLFLNGHETSRLQITEIERPKWFAFAFKPDFQPSVPTDPNTHDRNAWVRTIAGPKGDTVGIYMLLDNDSGNITIDGLNIGTFTNKQWHTIAFEHTTAYYQPWDTYIYTGTYNIYLNGQYVGAGTSLNGNMYNGLQTIVFSTADNNWEKGGSCFFDSIYLGELPKFQTLETCQMVYAVGRAQTSDLTADCRTNMTDLAVLASQWLQLNQTRP